MTSNLGDRMKENYENRWRFHLPRRIPVIIRVDGRAFHSVTKNAERPFDGDFRIAMAASAIQVGRDIQGCKAVYIQSDEASFLVTDYDELTTQAWFDYNKSKMETAAASQMSVAFSSKWNPQGTFDGRAFSIPKEEVVNYFLWRAKDWERNSLQMLARHHFSHSELNGKNQAAMHEMLRTKLINWNLLPDRWKNGTWWVNQPLGWAPLATIQPTYEEIAKYLDAYL